jgi:hypothetical protein
MNANDEIEAIETELGVNPAGTYATVVARLDGTVVGDGTVNPTNLLSNGDFESWSAGTSVAPDGWTLSAGVSISREGTTKKTGTYSAKIVGAAGGYLHLYLPNASYFSGRKITLGCWVYAAAADTATIHMSNGGAAISPVVKHTGDSTWQFLTTTATVDNPAGDIRPILGVAAGGTAYFDGAMCVEGASAFAFSPKPLDASLEIVAEVDETKFSHKLPVVINGTTYYIMMTAT